MLATVALATVASMLAYGAGHAAGTAEVWSYVGPGDVTCDTDIMDVPDCWELPVHPGN